MFVFVNIGRNAYIHHLIENISSLQTAVKYAYANEVLILSLSYQGYTVTQ